MPKLETGISNPTGTKTFDLLTKHKPDAFLEGFNKESEDEKDWKSMLGGIKDVATKFVDYKDKKGTINAISATLNDYGKLDDVTNAFFKTYDIAQDYPNNLWRKQMTQENLISPYGKIKQIGKEVLFTPTTKQIAGATHNIIALRNYIDNKDVDISKYENDDGYINDQNVKNSKTKEIKYGIWDMYNNGCELIAVNNTLVTLGDPKDIRKIAYDFERNGQTLYGLFGTSPFAVGDYFKKMVMMLTRLREIRKF